MQDNDDENNGNGKKDGLIPSPERVEIIPPKTEIVSASARSRGLSALQQLFHDMRLARVGNNDMCRKLDTSSKIEHQLMEHYGAARIEAFRAELATALEKHQLVGKEEVHRAKARTNSAMLDDKINACLQAFATWDKQLAKLRPDLPPEIRSVIEDVCLVILEDALKQIRAIDPDMTLIKRKYFPEKPARRHFFN